MAAVCANTGEEISSLLLPPARVPGASPANNFNFLRSQESGVRSQKIRSCRNISLLFCSKSKSKSLSVAKSIFFILTFFDFDSDPDFDFEPGCVFERSFPERAYPTRRPGVPEQRNDRVPNNLTPPLPTRFAGHLPLGKGKANANAWMPYQVRHDSCGVCVFHLPLTKGETERG
mgnify:CR=1 FL=1